MAHRPVTLQLIRDGQCTPWGFRMSGGADIGTPLLIQRVNMGSPSEGELQKGDIILFIGENDARKMSHQRASNIIAKAGNQLKLVVARTAGPPPISPTMSPTPGMPLTMYHLKSNSTSQGIFPLAIGHGNPDIFKPLPKTEFHNELGRSASNYDALHSSANQDEKAQISNQAYRTLPLITPSLKTTKDYPLGSYLRHDPDTSGRSKAAAASNVGNRVTDAYMLTKVQEAVLEKALSSPRASASSTRTPTPDSGYQSVYLRQYNSPINIYSTQNVVEALNAQTAAHKHHLNFASALKDVLLDAMTHLSNSPIVQVPLPSPGIPDLSKSPTYQLILEQEQMREHGAVENRVYNIDEIPESFESIQQSSSFKTVMSNVKRINV